MSLKKLTLFLLARILILVQSLAALMKSNAPFGDSFLSALVLHSQVPTSLPLYFSKTDRDSILPFLVNR